MENFFDFITNLFTQISNFVMDILKKAGVIAE